VPAEPSLDELSLPPLQLLCIEDNTLNRLLIEAVFSHYNDVQILMAATLSEGIRLVNAHMPDVILLDINLPDGNGLSLARHLRHHTPPEQRPLIIALSADALPESITEAMAAGADHYLVKPLQIARLLGILQTHFRV
jgi:CheY-like chemotaxis protein